MAAQASYRTSSFLPERDEFRRDLVDELLRRDAGFLGRLLHFLAVLIDAGEKENFFAFQPVIARDDIGQHLFVGVADVRRTVGVIDRGRDVEGLRHVGFGDIAGAGCHRATAMPFRLTSRHRRNEGRAPAAAQNAVRAQERKKRGEERAAPLHRPAECARERRRPTPTPTRTSIR